MTTPAAPCQAIRRSNENAIALARIRFLCNAHRVSLAAPAIGMHNT